ncbi:MAG: purine-nucleoside phosphorylase [Erysipelotrichaceae bacterium]|nr:purine-nucleoside phosphorylase [Erysipelotrichaceae bacterium]
MGEIYDRCKKAADYISQYFDAQDAIGIVLGSGLNELVKQIKDPVVIDYKDIPDFPVTTVSFQEGKLIGGYLNDRKVLCMNGRFHYYEGHDMESIVMPVRVMKLLKVKYAILTNVSGAINRNFKVGTFMFIDDFINYMGVNPLRGPNEDMFGPRFPDMSEAIDPILNEKAKKIADESGIKTESGVYIGFAGPSFETPAEIRFAAKIGADVVGMSTVPELIAARHCGLPVIAISCVVNMAAGISDETISVEDINKTSEMIKEDFCILIKGLVAGL